MLIRGGVLLALVAALHVTSALPYTTTKRPFEPITACRALMELMLVVDASDSISKADFFRQKKALANLMDELDLGEDRVRVGIVVFSTTIAHTVRLTGNRKKLKYEAKHLPHPRDGTMTSIAIARMNEEVKKFGRPGIPKAAIVITDGISKNKKATAEQAKMSREMGINMFAVGVGFIRSNEELEAIASSPSQVIKVDSFKELGASLSKLVKTVCPCPPPPDVPFGILNDGMSSIGSSRNYSCKTGFQMIGNPVIKCLNDSNWSKLTIECVGCPKPMTKQANAILRPKPRDIPDVIGDIREYDCLPGLAAPGIVAITCDVGPDGPFWTDPNYICSACPMPMPLKNAILLKGDEYVGTRRRYTCENGYTETGPLEIECKPGNGAPFWSELNLACIQCRFPPDMPNAIVDKTKDTSVGAKRMYTCMKGYVQTGPIFTTCVAQKGQTGWTPPDHSCTRCPPLAVVVNAYVHVNGKISKEGTTKVYTCNHGYIQTGAITTKCRRTKIGILMWTKIKHSCIACDMPPPIPNAVLLPQGDLLIGSIRRYRCLPRFIETGAIEVGCIPAFGKAEWTPAEHRCIGCDPPPKLPHARPLKGGDHLIGGSQLYRCIEGFMSLEPVSVVCLGAKHLAKWSEPDGVCVRRGCPDPEPMENAILIDGLNTVGTVRGYNCIQGYFATGTIEIKCKKNAKWSRPSNSCSACGPVPMVHNARAEAGKNLVGTERLYTCKTGYVPSATPKIACMPNAKWSDPNFVCKNCGGPPELAYAVVEAGRELVDSKRIYKCMPGYIETGPIRIECQRTAVWSRPVNYCKDCGEPYEVDGAIKITGTSRTVGSIQQYQCVEGYVASERTVSFCQNTGQWSLPTFRCFARMRFHNYPVTDHRYRIGYHQSVLPRVPIHFPRGGMDHLHEQRKISSRLGRGYFGGGVGRHLGFGGPMMHSGMGGAMLAGPSAAPYPQPSMGGMGHALGMGGPPMAGMGSYFGALGAGPIPMHPIGSDPGRVHFGSSSPIMAAGSMRGGGSIESLYNFQTGGTSGSRLHVTQQGQGQGHPGRIGPLYGGYVTGITETTSSHGHSSMSYSSTSLR